MGAIIDAQAHARLVADIGQAEKDGARVRLDGRGAKAPEGYEGGYWLGPTILDHASLDMDCGSRELFGPILTIVRVKTLEEAIALQDRTPYGNGASIFTTKGAIARHFVEHAQAGMVGVNIGVPVPREPFSFGGIKASKFGSSDITGQGGLEHWTLIKKITSKWELQADVNWMS
jgi:malonate-semialdehyde dehydrogenase (acetylating)/methylmalonate-semialdehyde dehydrogenase